MIEGLNGETLRRLYIKEGKSTYAIAKIYGCLPSSIRYRCRKYGITLRASTRAKEIKGLNKKTLVKLYIKEQKSTTQIAKMFGCTHRTIQIRCRKYGIKLRPRMKVIRGLNKSTLQRLYVKEGKSINKIAGKFSCSHSVIESRCRKYGIQLRSFKRIKGLNKSVLQKLYVQEGKTVREIAKIIGCSREPVRLKCKQFGVPLRPTGNKRVDIDESALRRLFVKEEKSMAEIAKIFDCAIGTISNRAKRYGVQR